MEKRLEITEEFMDQWYENEKGFDEMYDMEDMDSRPNERKKKQHQRCKIIMYITQNEKEIESQADKRIRLL